VRARHERPVARSWVAALRARATRTAEGYGLVGDRGTEVHRFAVRRGTMTAALDPSAEAIWPVARGSHPAWCHP
jgi:hypothetical protein